MILVHPYCYSQLHKDEIEHLVTKMLLVGIIQPSNNPYSSLFLLVNKKDGSWHFCIDYKALKLAIVPNEFPILVLEELSDDFHEGIYV